MAHLYHAPADCPVCGDDLIVTRKGCRTCGTELAGEFASCVYCGLESSELELLRVFLSSRGNLREVEKHLGVSYPTARARLDAVIDKLGFTASGDPTVQDSPATAPTDEPQQGLTAQEQILARVATGEISSENAATLLAGL
ncbi:MAG: DUF2089 domain-containing protein [Propionibacteriaceae bacterium]|nr:DUF2089 domain-containing protein [Propionibacteriaceae bacterium]